MTITFENNNDLIVYALEKIISHARYNQYIVLAQSVWWISSVISLQPELVSHIDHLRIRGDISKLAIVPDWPNKLEILSTQTKSLSGKDSCYIHPSRLAAIQGPSGQDSDYRDDSVSTTETDIHNEVIKNCELFLAQSKQERKAIGPKNQQASRIVKRNPNKLIKTFGTETQGIDSSELRRRKAAGECQGCSWPGNRKGSHRAIDCIREKWLEKGTAPKKYFNKD
jgi:hypothetical protein